MAMALGGRCECGRNVWVPESRFEGHTRSVSEKLGADDAILGNAAMIGDA